jgi:predicted RNA-binding protein with RPS1 domain
MIVDVFGIEAFLPGSQIDVKPIRDYDQYVNKTMEFKVVKINHEFKNVVVSHKALIEADIEVQKKEIIGQLEKGQVLEGVVKNITSYGVFIDLGGVDGLIHITDLSWSRINHPSEVLELDQKLNVVILDFDDEKTRIQLGLKQLNAHPWDALGAELKVGDKVPIMIKFPELKTEIDSEIVLDEGLGIVIGNYLTNNMYTRCLYDYSTNDENYYIKLDEYITRICNIGINTMNIPYIAFIANKEFSKGILKGFYYYNNINKNKLCIIDNSIYTSSKFNELIDGLINLLSIDDFDNSFMILLLIF